MRQGSRNPAIYAGLLGAVMGLVPTQAMALSMEELMSSSAAPYVQFGLGCVAGAALSSAIHIAINAIRGRGAERADARAQAPEQPVVQQQVSDAPAREQAPKDEAPAAQPQRHVPASKASARHMGAREWEQSGVIRVQDVPASEVAPANPRSSHMAKSPRHKAPEATQAEASSGREGSSRPRARHAAPAPSSEAKADPAQGKDKVEAPLPVRPYAGAHVATDYSDIAENYVKRKSFRERMSARAAGVAAVLADRIGADPLDGLPVIERADGTVGDVGTGWWNHALGSSIRRIEDLANEEQLPEVSSASLATPRYTQYERQTEASSRSRYISQNVAEVNVGMYPERRTVEELEQEDVWEKALQAMSERLAQQSAPVFVDAIGTIDTLDEPDGLDAPTSFIPFRTPAGHPEVVDASTYVDYLIDDEFSRNPSPIARKSSRDFLTVIQGGSQKTRQAPQPEEPTYRPKHFAPQHAKLAREA